jgi:hypothetical protein
MPPSTPDAVAGLSRPAGVTFGLPRPGLPVLVPAVLAALGAIVWSAPVMTRMIADVDFPFHLATAEEFAATGRITMPHFLLQVTLGALAATRLFGSLQQAGIVYFTALYALTAAAACWYIARRTHGPGAGAAGLILGAAVLLAGPILPRGGEDLFLIGYFPPNAYHNPTMLVAKPLLVLTLMAGVAALTRTSRASRTELALLAAPVLLLGIAKPNYLGCLVPALAAVSAWNALRRQPVSWPRVAAVGGVATAALVVSFLLYRVLDVGAGAGIVVAPLAVIGHYADVGAGSIARALASSLAFPIVATMLWPVAAWRDAAMRLAWMGAAAGLVVSYGFAEAGPRMYDGNFLWTGQMAVFVLFVATAGFVAARWLDPPDERDGRVDARIALGIGRAAAVGGVLWLHVTSGIRHVQIKVEAAQWLSFWT